MIIFVSILNYYIVNQFIRITIVTLFLTFNVWYIFREDIRNCVIVGIISQMVIMISEMIFAIVISFGFKLNSQQIIETQFGQFFSNFIISIIVLIISSFSFFQKFYKLLIKITKNIAKRQLILFSSMLIIIANILMGILYYNIEFKYLIIFNTCLTLFCLFIIIHSFKTKDNYIKVYDKYNTTLKSLKEYEYILDRYRISNHENKNQLLTIRNMIPKTNKKIITYIDEFLENKLKDDDKAMIEVSRIPAGGLRGLIYSKVLTMKSMNIDYALELSKDIKTIDFINIDDSLMLDICKVIGVYMDNAIQAVKDLKEKYIRLQMYIDGKNMVISILNNYKGTLELENIENPGYTTKGNGHGYGLVLANEIINNNKKLYNQKSVSKETFCQILKIKM